MSKIIGIDFQNTKAYLNNFNPKHGIKYNTIYNVKSGLKWECVEFVRRWYIKNFGVTFSEVACAYDLLKINSVYSIFDHSKYCFFLKTNINTINTGDILVFKKMKYFPCGHLAIVTYLDHKGNLYLSEQNIPWVHPNFSRIIHKTDLYNFGFCGYKTLKFN